MCVCGGETLLCSAAEPDVDDEECRDESHRNHCADPTLLREFSLLKGNLTLLALSVVDGCQFSSVAMLLANKSRIVSPCYLHGHT